MHYDVSNRFNFRSVPESGLEQTFAKISQEHEDDEDEGYIRFLIYLGKCHNKDVTANVPGAKTPNTQDHPC